MRVKLGIIWEELQDSLWLIPACLTVVAVILAAVTVELDRRLLTDGPVDIYLAFGGGSEGARGVLSTIGSTVITVTGVIFSVTIVALQLASSQFTPRVLRSFVGDRANQVVLGVFISTFTYTLLVLRTIRSPVEDGQGFVPSISVAVAIGLALVSIGLLIFFIHHAARSIQASVIIDRAAQDTQQVADRLFPLADDDIQQAPPVAWPEDAQPSTIAAESAGYIQAIDEDVLFDLASRSHTTLRVERRIGEHILPGAALITYWPPGPLPDDEVAKTVRTAFVLGPDRTLRNDLELGVRQLTDIALRALSPSLNDPTTAINCFDRLAEILVRVGNRQTPSTTRRGNGAYLVMWRCTLDDLMDSIFGLTRRAVAADPHVAQHVIMTLGRIGASIRPEHRPNVARQIVAILVTAEASLSLSYDIDPVREAAARSLKAVDDSADAGVDLFGHAPARHTAGDRDAPPVR